ncbi:MAG: methylamine utilization protein [Pseudomonadota bacterium]
MFKSLLALTYLTFAGVSASLCSLPLQAADLTIDVVDTTGSPIENAVVYAEPENKAAMPPASAIVEQRGKQFNPLVSVVQTGSDISFPNFDSVRHHVYSFSPAKTFELKLYSGVPTSPVKFDKAGTVVLGCNIHDYMVAFIHVVDTPYFTKTNKSGKATLRDLPNGNYTLKAWHYALAKEKEIIEKPLVFKDAQNIVMQLSLKHFMIPAKK